MAVAIPTPVERADVGYTCKEEEWRVSEDNTGEQALMLGRDIPLLPNQWPNEGQQHELHGVREPARARVYKNKRLKLPKPHGCERVIGGVCFHGNKQPPDDPANWLRRRWRTAAEYSRAQAYSTASGAGVECD
nr:unnamed protein product [Digitaria exilis]